MSPSRVALGAHRDCPPANQGRVNDPHPERGWAGVPATRLGTFVRSVRPTRLNQPVAVPGDRERSSLGFFRPSKPFAVPQPISILAHVSVGGSSPRHLRIAW